MASFEDLPAELLMEIISRLNWGDQLTAKRVSRRWKAAADVCLPQRKELTITDNDVNGFQLSPEMLLKLLQKMPSLRCLSVVARKYYMSGGGKLPFQAVERLCASYPQLQSLALSFDLDDASVKTLLRCLPGLRSLELSGVLSDHWLSLLPTGLESLSLYSGRFLDADIALHLGRLPRLRELRLDQMTTRGDELAAVLACCLRLENLSVRSCYWEMSARTTELPHSPQLRELSLTGTCFDQLDISSVLSGCSRLERCKVRWLHILPLAVRVRLPCLTSMELCDFGMDNATFYQLCESCPGVRYLKIGPTSGTKECVSERGQASGLKNLTRLSVLDLVRRSGSKGVCSVFPKPSRLPLKALALDVFPSSEAFHLIEVFECWPTLEVIRVRLRTDMRPGPDFTPAIRELLTEHAQTHHKTEVTLLIEARYFPDEATLRLNQSTGREIPSAWSHLGKLPRNVRVMEDTSLVWEELTGCHPWL